MLALKQSAKSDLLAPGGRTPPLAVGLDRDGNTPSRQAARPSTANAINIINLSSDKKR